MCQTAQTASVCLIRQVRYATMTQGLHDGTVCGVACNASAATEILPERDDAGLRRVQDFNWLWLGVVAFLQVA